MYCDREDKILDDDNVKNVRKSPSTGNVGRCVRINDVHLTVTLDVTVKRAAVLICDMAVPCGMAGVEVSVYVSRQTMVREGIPPIRRRSPVIGQEVRRDEANFPTPTQSHHRNLQTTIVVGEGNDL